MPRRPKSSLLRSIAVVAFAAVLAPAVLLAQFLAFTLLIGYDPPAESAGGDGWACFRAAVFLGSPAACPESFSLPGRLEAAGAAGVSLLAGVGAAALVVLVSRPWHDRRFDVALPVRITTAVVIVALLLWTAVASFGLFYADNLAA